MAITVAVDAREQNVTGKTLSIQSKLTSKLKESTITVTFGAGDNYATGGNTVDLSLGGRISTIHSVVFCSNDKGVLLQYVPSANNVASTGKFKAYGVDPGAAGGAVVGFVELPSSSTVVNSMVVNVIVRGV